METIVELYDKEPVLNFLAACSFRPENIVYLCDMDSPVEENLKTARDFFRLRGQRVNVSAHEVKGRGIKSYMRAFDEIYHAYPGCVIDVTGGSDLALVAAGMFTQQHEQAKVFTFSKRKRRFFDIYNCPEVNDLKLTEKFTIDELIAMSGAKVSGHGHFDPKGTDGNALSGIGRIWDIFLANRYTWHRNVQYLQSILKLHGKSLHVEAPLMSPSSSGRFERSQYKIMRELADAGVIQNMHVTKKKLTFDYKSEDIRRCLTDVGMCLELYVYKTAIESGFFDDVSISVIIDWNGRIAEPHDTTNEIDVMLTKGATPVFISCKTGNPSTTALNEVHTLATRLGGVFAKPVLVTMNELSELSPSTYKRAGELDITIIEYSDLAEGKLEQKLKDIVK